MSGKRLDLSTLAGAAAPAKVPVFTKAAPSRTVPLEDVAPNPRNKRVITDELAAEMADSLAEHGQLSSSLVVTRKAFLAIFPDDEEQIGPKAKYVQVTGGCRHAGYTLLNEREREKGTRPAPRGIEVQIKDDRAKDQLTFLAATAAENLDRNDLNPIEEALAIAEMATVEGVNQKMIAEKLKRTAPWVTQRLALLKLLPELQQLIVAGELLVSVGRDIGRLPQSEQMAAYQQYKQQRDAPPVAAPEPTSEPATPEPEPTPEPDNPEPVDTPERTSPQVAAIKRLGGTGAKVAETLMETMESDQLFELFETLKAKLGK
jgi:ParB family transcriptional regulator, chromosome partitioning protein